MWLFFKGIYTCVPLTLLTKSYGFPKERLIIGDVQTVHPLEIGAFRLNLKIEVSDCYRKIYPTEYRSISVGVDDRLHFWMFSWSISRKSRFSDWIRSRRLEIFFRPNSDQFHLESGEATRVDSLCSTYLTPTYHSKEKGQWWHKIEYIITSCEITWLILHFIPFKISKLQKILNLQDDEIKTLLPSFTELKISPPNIKIIMISQINK